MNGDEPRRTVAVIPARFASTRFPGKAIAPIHGTPMIVHVIRRVRRAGRIDEVVVATDDERIERVAAEAGARPVRTDPGHESGTDRVAEAARAVTADVVINVQGDQPLIDPEALDRMAAALSEPGGPDVVTLAATITSDDEWRRADVVKVVMGDGGDALYFSRAPVPYARDAAGGRPRQALKHVGVYGFRRAALMAFTTWPPTVLERLEGLEQLRLLEHGVRIGLIRVERDCPSVDRPEDVERVEQMINSVAEGDVAAARAR